MSEILTCVSFYFIILILKISLLSSSLLLLPLRPSPQPLRVSWTVWSTAGRVDVSAAPAGRRLCPGTWTLRRRCCGRRGRRRTGVTRLCPTSAERHDRRKKKNYCLDFRFWDGGGNTETQPCAVWSDPGPVRREEKRGRRRRRGSSRQEEETQN